MVLNAPLLLPYVTKPNDWPAVGTNPDAVATARVPLRVALPETARRSNAPAPVPSACKSSVPAAV